MNSRDLPPISTILIPKQAACFFSYSYLKNEMLFNGMAYQLQFTKYKTLLMTALRFGRISVIFTSTLQLLKIINTTKHPTGQLENTDKDV